ncbi:hypothetical protein H4I95_03903 [Botrytis cinerea]
MGIFNSVRKLFISDRGHTVLGNLMMAILKPHTSCPPVTVDGSSKTQIIGREEKLSSVEDETLIRRASALIYLETMLLFQSAGSTCSAVLPSKPFAIVLAAFLDQHAPPTSIHQVGFS